MSRLFPILALLVAIGLFFGYISPTYEGPVTTLKNEIRDFNNALAAAARFKQKEAQLAAARAELPAEKVERLEALLPDGVDNVQLILDLNALAARSGMRLGDFETSLTSADGTDGAQANGGVLLETEGPVDSLDLTMTGTGTYAAFRAFLSGLESSLRPLDIVGLQVTPTETGVYTYDITTRIYWLR
ncbi:MAG TPA: hypothetical protein VFY28_03255 [Candidatus Paceibacterota bacterium]|nr:hypothetical protein [Candidatus Paceibacterota bacterium]